VFHWRNELRLSHVFRILDLFRHDGSIVTALLLLLKYAEMATMAGESVLYFHIYCAFIYIAFAISICCCSFCSSPFIRP
jgi:hypothetical protein